MCKFAVISLHLPLRPPHPERPGLVLTAGRHPVRRSSSPPSSRPPFCCVGRAEPSAAGRRSCPTIAAVGPGKQHRNKHEKAAESELIILNLHCLARFGYFLHFPESLSSPTEGDLHLAVGPTSEQNNGSSLIFTL